MINPSTQTSLGSYALIAGIAMVFMGTTPYAELAVYNKLVAPGHAEETVRNILANEGLFISGILAYLINFIADLVAAWAFYFLLKPVNEALSLLTAWCRLVYTLISLTALVNLVTVLRLLNHTDALPEWEAGQMHNQVMLSLYAFRNGWSFAFFFFAIHLVFLGYLMFRSGYIPRIIGALIIIDGLGWLISTLKPYLYPNVHLDFIAFTYFGELVLLIWLLVRGWKIKAASSVQP